MILLFLWLFLAGSEELDLGSVTGSVLDSDTRDPVELATVHLVELNRVVAADQDGTFDIQDIPYGSYTLRFYRVGYHPFTQRVSVTQHEPVKLTILLQKSETATGTVVVESEATLRTGNQPESVLTGKDLRSQLGKTIAETMAIQPGLAQRSMGPAPSRPVIRGLSGDRLLILDDGARTGDLSATSPDHALTIDPMTAERIEVYQGPEAFLFGSSVLGGVINVVKNQIMTDLSPHYHGAVSGQGESVNAGGTAGFAISGPAGPLMIRTDGSFRQAGDISTPEGTLKNTWIQTKTISTGLSHIWSDGYAGVSAALYQTGYGIPGGFTGGHQNGVDISINRRSVEVRSGFSTPYWFANRVEAGLNHVYYYHLEEEKEGITGAEFGLLTTNAFVHLTHGHQGTLERGRWGLWFENRDYASGKLTFTPASTEQSVAGFLIEEWTWKSLRLKTAFRFDYKSVSPNDPDTSNRIGYLAPRTFSDWSGGFSLDYPLTQTLSVGGHLMRTFRAPGIEELYSDGPHLAAYSFEIGNPALNQENGLGQELWLKSVTPDQTWKLAIFHTFITGYLYPANTGRVNSKLPPLLDYQFTGADARLMGTEGQIDQQWGRWQVAASVSSVMGTLVKENRPLPLIPPVSGKLQIRFRPDQQEHGLTGRWAIRQWRTGEFEEPTNGYWVTDWLSQFHWQFEESLVTADLVVENLFNVAYRNHLSRVKSIIPEPGRNVKAMVRYYF